ncbi:MAG: TIGR04282 family arsenosugar biosynthesis glycosyltransferase [Nitrospiria bacterium]
MQTDGLVIFAKAPVAGKVKTRLFPHLTSEDATQLHRAFVLDTLTRLKTIRGIRRYIACYPSLTHPFFQQLSQDFQIGLLDQQGDDLGQRMGGIVKTLMQSGCSRVVLIGTDIPTLPTSYVKDAFNFLQRRAPQTDVVLGPSEDGGYYLIGLSRWVPQLFEGIPWSTDKVFEITLQKIHDLGLKFEILPKWFDVDDYKHLKTLAAQLAQQPDLAPHTWAFLKNHHV